MSVFIHDSAVVDDGAKIGAGTKVWHFCHVATGARIGKDAVLGQNVFVADGAVIGDRCRIQNNVSIYDGVVLGEDVFCGPSMVFTNVINPRSAVQRKDEFRPTRVGRGATFGANCTIVCGVEIGEFAFVGAGAVVTADVPAFALVTGVPARQSGWMSAHGEKLDLPMSGSGEANCPATRELYVLDDGRLRRTLGNE
jgi:UDP-2-acetamido-3-amino-2,3-dideoxy-glucuronate N-acetyltransferase